jgi:hypothetical protein
MVMSKIKIKPSLQEYDEGWEGREEIINMSLLEIGEMIDERLEGRPLDRNKDSLRAWRKELNGLIEHYNDRAGDRIYTHVY